MKQRSLLAFSLLSVSFVMFSCSMSSSHTTSDRNIIPAIHYQSPRLQVTDAGAETGMAGAMGGLAGALAAAVIQEIIASNNTVPRLNPRMLYEDPLLRLKSRFLLGVPDPLVPQDVTEAQRDISVGEEQTAEEEFRPLKRSFGSRRLLDFRTTELRAMTHRMRGIKPILGYGVRVRLINLDDARVEWEGFCHIPEDQKSPSTEAELSADNGKQLRNTFNGAADRCADLLLQEFLIKGLPKP